MRKRHGLLPHLKGSNPASGSSAVAVAVAVAGEAEAECETDDAFDEPLGEADAGGVGRSVMAGEALCSSEPQAAMACGAAPRKVVVRTAAANVCCRDES